MLTKGLERVRERRGVIESRGQGSAQDRHARLVADSQTEVVDVLLPSHPADEAPVELGCDVAPRLLAKLERQVFLRQRTVDGRP